MSWWAWLILGVFITVDLMIFLAVWCAVRIGARADELEKVLFAQWHEENSR